MEDFGTAPYWLGSRTFIAASFAKSQATKSSAIFDKHGVSEIGLRSFFRFASLAKVSHQHVSIYQVNIAA